MSIVTLVLFQFLAHIIADYFLQNKRLAIEKNTLGFKSPFLVWHVLIVFILSWLLSFQVKFFIASGVIAITHYFIDGFKARFNNHPRFKNYAFFVDQLLHLAILITVTVLFAKYYGTQLLWEPPIDSSTLWIVIGYISCLKPANILIKEIFKSSEIDVAIAEQEELDELSTTNELPNAGKLIGVLERVLTLTFILIGQFQAVGFLIAAKSILRYKDTETLKTEYVLIGTMLSFGIAVLFGVAVAIF